MSSIFAYSLINFKLLEPQSTTSKVPQRNEYFMKGKGKKEAALLNGKHTVDEYSEGESGSSFPVRYRDLKKEK